MATIGIHATQEGHMIKAEAVTAFQIRIAKRLIAENLLVGDQQPAPELLGAVIQALAINYAATIEAAK